ncbi:MAG: hypothetical protein K0S39_2195 [Paenibacillus sp.]|jgi:hypothetical protein|nr:hypothetical protein [Paenibacillus sp.]
MMPAVRRLRHRAVGRLAGSCSIRELDGYYSISYIILSYKERDE